MAKTFPNPGLHRLAWITMAATYVLLVAGALVTSTDNGLAVPDWPLSFGTLFPEMEGGVFYEHGHRLVAGTVGLLTLFLAVWTWRREERRAVRRLALAALLAVVAQATLGGITVLMKLPQAVSASHATLGQIFFCLVIALAVVTSPTWRRAGPPAPGPASALPWVVRFAVGAVLLQLLLGAFVRHAAVKLGPILIVHVVWAVVVFGLLSAVSFKIFDRHEDHPMLLWPAGALVLLVLAQLVLGVTALARLDAVVVRTAHVAVGALILGVTMNLALWTSRLLPRPGVEDGPVAPDGAEDRGARLEGVSA